MNIGLFYGSSTCYTEIIAEKIQAILGESLVTLFNVRDTSLAKMLAFDVLICGIPTWDFGELQEDWETRWSEINALNLTGKTVALFGLGDQLGYGEWFQDALGILHDALNERGAKIIGYWPNQGYQFDTSKALTPDKSQFVGLALDEVNQFQKTDERLQTWLEQVLTELSHCDSQHSSS